MDEKNNGIDVSAKEYRFPDNNEVTDSSLSKEERMNDLITELTGVEDGEMSEMVPIMAEDQKELLLQHGYPPFEMRFNAPAKYKESLLVLAEEQGVTTGVTERAFPYFDRGTNTVFLRDPESFEDKDLKNFIHELTHALDTINFPDLTPAQREYRAYLADLGDVTRVAEALGDDFKEFFFGGLGIMGSLYFQERDAVEDAE